MAIAPLPRSRARSKELRRRGLRPGEEGIGAGAGSSHGARLRLLMAKGVGTVIRGQRALMETSGSCLRRVCRVVANLAAVVVRNRSRRGDRNLSEKRAKGVAAAGPFGSTRRCVVVWWCGSVLSGPWWDWLCWRLDGAVEVQFNQKRVVGGRWQVAVAAQWCSLRTVTVAVGRDSGWSSWPGTLRGFRRRKRQRQTPCSEKLEAAGGAPLALSLFKVPSHRSASFVH